MRAFLSDIRNAVRKIWFTVTVVTVVITLWLDLGTNSYWLLRGGIMDPMELLTKSLSGSGSALSLPLLASLPCAAQAFQELLTGAARYSVSRCGFRSYILGKLLTVLIMASLSQAAGILIFTGLLMVISPASIAAFPVWPFLTRLLSAMVFSSIGGTAALLSSDTVSAYAVPTALSFALSMLSSRFFIGLKYIDPRTWLTGDRNAILILSVLLLFTSLLYAIFLRKEINYYV